MSFFSRDFQATVVHVDSEVIRATLGLQDLLAKPSVTLRACYAVPMGSSSRVVDANPSEDANGGSSENSAKSGWIVGADLQAAMAQDGFADQWEVRWPFRETKATDDWEGREFILAHIFSLLNITITSNTSPMLLIPPAEPATLPLPDQALYTQLAFENLNVPGFSIVPLPLASLFALNATTGLVVHVGRTSSSIFIVTDSIVRWECSVTVDVGMADCEEWFRSRLAQDSALEKALKEAVGEAEPWSDALKDKLVAEVADATWRICGEDDQRDKFAIPAAKTPGGKTTAPNALPVPAADDGDFDVVGRLVGGGGGGGGGGDAKAKKSQQATDKANKAAASAAAAAEAADAVVLKIPSLPGQEIPLGSIRHQLCEPLFAGRGTGESLWEGVGRALEGSSLSLAEKSAVLDAVGVVGEVARIPSFPVALMTYLSPLLLSSTDVPSESQPTSVRLLTIPSYFTNFSKSATHLAPFLGGSMVAKVAFTDSVGKHCVTKVDYNAKGPACVYSVTHDES